MGNYDEEAGRELLRTGTRDIPDWRNKASGYYDQYNQGLQNTLGQMGQTQDYLQQQMVGNHSVAAMQLQQGLQQNLAAQSSLAHSASPNNQAMAQRQAAMQSARLGYGMAGQGALAGLQERNQAAQLLNQSQLGAGQLQGGAAANNGQLVNQAFQNQVGAYTGLANAPDPWYVRAAGGVAAGAAMMSDERLKENVKDADGDSKRALGRLNAVTYDYKDQKHGAGRQFGIMAQDLERAGLGNAVIETREGKAVDTRRLSLANTAMLASMHKRLSELEGPGDDDGDED